jgi:hypothetical protein
MTTRLMLPAGCSSSQSHGVLNNALDADYDACPPYLGILRIQRHLLVNDQARLPAGEIPELGAAADAISGTGGSLPAAEDGLRRAAPGCATPDDRLDPWIVMTHRGIGAQAGGLPGIDRACIMSVRCR